MDKIKKAVFWFYIMALACLAIPRNALALDNPILYNTPTFDTAPNDYLEITNISASHYDVIDIKIAGETSQVTNGGFYQCGYNNGAGHWGIGDNSDWTYTQNGNAPVNGDDIGCYYDGTNVSIYLNGSIIFSHLVTTHTNNKYVDVYINGGDLYYDSLVKTNPYIGTPTPTGTEPTPTGTEPTPTPTGSLYRHTVCSQPSGLTFTGCYYSPCPDEDGIPPFYLEQNFVVKGQDFYVGDLDLQDKYFVGFRTYANIYIDNLPTGSGSGIWTGQSIRIEEEPNLYETSQWVVNPNETETSFSFQNYININTFEYPLPYSHLFDIDGWSRYTQAWGLNGGVPSVTAHYSVYDYIFCVDYVDDNPLNVVGDTVETGIINPPATNGCILPSPFAIDNLNIGDWLSYYWCLLKNFLNEFPQHLAEGWTTTKAQIVALPANIASAISDALTTLLVPDFSTGSDLSQLSAEVKTLLTTKSPMGYVFFWVNYDWDAIFTAVPEADDTKFTYNLPVIASDGNISQNPIQLNIDLAPDAQIADTIVMIKTWIGYMLVIPFGLALARLAMTTFGITRSMMGLSGDDTVEYNEWQNTHRT